jgi:hypothetical protein
MTRITGVTRRDDTIRRIPSNGDNWHLTWAADDTQLMALCDGRGFPGTPRPHSLYNTALYRVHGGPDDPGFELVEGYPHIVDDISDDVRLAETRYYGFATLAVGGRVYQYQSTFSAKISWDMAGLIFNGAKLVYSDDGGATWRNQDGSTPVRYEGWDERSRDTMVFFDEPDAAFSLLSLLQMGKDYAANTDGYVYVYGPNGTTDGTMNELVMFRVATDRVLDRSSYEYFAGRDAAGDAVWSTDIADRRPTVTYPTGWVNTTLHPYAWQPFVVYDEPLGLYLMTSWAPGVGEQGEWFAKPSYLGIWSSTTPWGPWEQVHEETAWLPGGDTNARCYSPVIAPKWISDDGTSFWLVWTDFQSPHGDRSPEVKREIRGRVARGELDPGDAYHAEMDTITPYYAFNLQRVDLQVE